MREAAAGLLRPLLLLSHFFIPLFVSFMPGLLPAAFFSPLPKGV
jgi:hypothetical protein